MRALEHPASDGAVPGTAYPVPAPVPGPYPQATVLESRVFIPRQGMNPLVQAAHPLLEIGALLRHDPGAPAIHLEELRTRLVAMVRAFVDSCARIDTETVAAARYCLCTFVDETIGAAVWGGEAWSTRSLLVVFHGEVSGGERFFTILHKLSQNPAANIDALELLYIMLALGMQGRYRLSPAGGAALEQVRDQLGALIRGVRGAPEAALSPRWRGDKPLPRRPWPARPMWWLMLGGICALASWHAVLGQRLLHQARLAALAREAVRVAAHVTPVAQVSAIPPLPPLEPRPAARSLFAPGLAEALAPDVAAQRVHMDRRADRIVLTLDTDGMFASGSDRLAASFLPLVNRIGEALRNVPGQVVVVGHTDDQRPAPGAPSNWALSLSRATHVVDLLRRQAGQPERFLAQGKGDTQPIASNDTAIGQARNRRVVIVVLAPGASM
jgi:type VI secretion system protein ImpK